MSERSERIAQGFQRVKEDQAVRDALDLKQSDALDEGFKRLREELQQNFESQCNELNQEPQIGNILECGLSDDEWKITRNDTGAILSIKFDSVLRTVKLNCDRPTKFKYTIQVKPAASSWMYTDAKGTSLGQDAAGSTADKALRALLGLDWKA